MTRNQARILVLFTYPMIKGSCVEMITDWFMTRGISWTMHQVELDPGLLAIPSKVPMFDYLVFPKATADAPRWALHTREVLSGVV